MKALTRYGLAIVRLPVAAGKKIYAAVIWLGRKVIPVSVERKVQNPNHSLKGIPESKQEQVQHSGPSLEGRPESKQEQVQHSGSSLEGRPESKQEQIQSSDHSLAETSVTANDRSQPERRVEQVAANPVLNPRRRVPGDLRSFWNRFVRGHPFPDIQLSEADERKVIAFTSRFCVLENPGVLLKHLLDSIISIQDNSELLKNAMDLIDQGLVACLDRPLQVVDEIETLAALSEAQKAAQQGQLEKLKEFGRKTMHLNVCDRETRAVLKKKGITQDEVLESLLFMRNGLMSQGIALPVSAKNMLLQDYSGLDRRDIDNTVLKIKQDCTDDKFEQWLLSWEPWQIHLRKKNVTDCGSLPSIELKAEAIQECPITYDNSGDMVQLGNKHYSYEALRRVYIESGRDPSTNLPFKWEDVKRIVRTQ